MSTNDALKSIQVFDSGEGLYICIMDDKGEFSICQQIEGRDTQRAFVEWKQKRDAAVSESAP